MPAEIQIVQNGSLFLTFDFYTPRPHLIMLKNKNKEKTTNPSKSGSLKGLLLSGDLVRLVTDIINICLKFCDKLILENQQFPLILSLHTGSFSNKDKFHAHLCLSLEYYINLFHHYTNIKLNSSHKTKNWTISKDINNNKENFNEIYLLNVRNYELLTTRKCQQYKQDDLRKILAFNDQESKLLAAWKLNHPEIEIIFHENEPCLGFKFKTSIINFNSINTSHYERIYICMIDFAFANGYFQKPKGCHLCLNLNYGDSISMNLNFKQFNNQFVQGYIHLCANEYYKLFETVELANNWKVAFEANNQFYIQT